MEFRLIRDNEFIQLVMLNSLMYAEMDIKINEFQATNTLFYFMKQGTNFRSWGLFDGDTLVGFVHGMDFNDTIYQYTGIYLLPSHRKYIKDLVESSFKAVEDLGYKGWEADATNSKIASILQKYGASVKHTRYCKEFG